MNKIVFNLLVFASISTGQFSLSVDRIGGAKQFGEENSVRITLMHNGTAINTIERKLPYDVPFPATVINETNGIFIVAYPFDGFVEAYNAKGSKIWEQNFFKELGPNYERTITIALGTSTIAFLTSDAALPHAMVHRYTLDGAKQWETVLPYAMGYEIAQSPDEQTIVAGSYESIGSTVHHSASMINAKGTKSSDIDILFRKAVFSEDQRSIALSSEREVVIVSNETKKELSRTVKRTTGIITDVVWNSDNVIVQECDVITPKAERFYYSRPTFISYTKELNEISRQTLDGISFRSSSMKRTGTAVELRYEGKSVKIINR